ncbi:MAG TPA: hypothetical protein PLQ64_05270 [Thiobacillaceae bacterium]|nr:hypothetical protein [Thiobacillaceae bacterium]HNA81861.1 hypothetical protein [Thiobacillaceae bacterium]HNH89285.1 hypothetical protein [Thiobacillaceae bacterium]HNI07191.1 hypothetical protein [Thiobacillaceae bacterium]
MNFPLFFLLVALAAISFGFARAANACWRYFKQLEIPPEAISPTLRESRPRLHKWMAFSLPVTSVGLAFCAVIAALGFAFVLIRIIKDNF